MKCLFLFPVLYLYGFNRLAVFNAKPSVHPIHQMQFLV
uniref:Uncharacterized protein n=1 Tax=Anguilla anguilla TaxID=7936 RepID=A0A0E9VUD3_ANGAN